MKFLILLTVLSISLFSISVSAKILSVGSITINACKDAKILADWYSRFGFELSEYQGVYYGQLDTAAGPFVFGIHQGVDAKKCSGNISVTYSVENFEKSLLSLKEKGIVPVRTHNDPEIGQFAYFLDPDGNEVKIWGQQ